MADNPLAGIIQQVDRSGKQINNFTDIGAPGGAAKNLNVTPDRPPQSKWKKLLCSCFAPTVDDYSMPIHSSGQNGAAGGAAIPADANANGHIGENGENQGFLLPEKCIPAKITLVLDLDETLVHSSFKPVPNADFVVPVEVDGIVHRVFVCKRPGVDEFMKKVGELFEVVVFTASLDKYANPVLDLLDRSNSVHYRLFREACVLNEGSLVKDLTRLGRDVSKVIIVDNSPTSYMLQPENAVAISSWFDDPADTQLYTLLPWFVNVSHDENVLPGLERLHAEMTANGGNFWGPQGEAQPGGVQVDQGESVYLELMDSGSS